MSAPSPPGTPGILFLRDGDGDPVNVEVLLLPSGNIQTQSTPSDATGAPYTPANPLPVLDVAFPVSNSGGAPQVASSSIEDLLRLVLAEQRLSNLLLAQAFSINDDLDRLRAALAGLN